MAKRRRRGLLMMTLAAVVVLFATGMCLEQCQARELAEKDSESGEDAKFREEDLSFLDEEEGGIIEATEEDVIGFFDSSEHEEELIDPGNGHEGSRKFDEDDVVVLGSWNFSEFVASHHHVLANFYSPWCSHCRRFAPEYAVAATTLKGEAVLAKVDATVHEKLAEDYSIDSYPTILFFIDGVRRTYPGHHVKDEVVTWVRKKTRPAVISLHSKDMAKRLQSHDGTIAIALLNSLEGPEVQEYAFAARQVDDVLFFQTESDDAAEVFNFTRGVKRPALLLLKLEVEKFSWFEGQFKRDTIEEFVTKYKVPLVTTFNKKNSGLIFDSPIKKQVILFTGPDDYEMLITDFREAARLFVGKLIFVCVDLNDTEQAPGIIQYFGISKEKPTVMGYEAEETGRKYLMEDEITIENVKVFGANFLANNLKPRLKSGPIPDTNDGDVKVVVGLNFDAIVLDETKDVLLEIYAPWCGHCQDLQPTWDKLASRLKAVESIIIANMDGTKNEHERAKVDGYPTILLFRAGQESLDPIAYYGDRTVKNFIKFLKDEAVIPFMVPRHGNAMNESLAFLGQALGYLDNKTESSEPSHQDVHKNLFDQLKDEL